MYYLGLQLEDLRASSSVLYASTTFISHLRTSKEAWAVLPRPRLSMSTCPPSKRCTTNFSGNDKSPWSCVLPAALSSTAHKQSSDLAGTSVILTTIFLQADTSCPHLGHSYLKLSSLLLFFNPRTSLGQILATSITMVLSYKVLARFVVHTSLC